MMQVLKHCEHFVRVLITFLRVFPQRLGDDLLKLAGSLRDVTAERRRLLCEDRCYHFCWCVACKWCSPCDQFVKHHANTPDIAALINPATCGTRLFWRHITDGPKHRPQVGFNHP